MFGSLSDIAKDLKENLSIYQRAIHDPRTPMMARLILKGVIAYVSMPFDIIPDFIPVVGHIDDAVIVPGLVTLALKLIPDEVMEDSQYRKPVKPLSPSKSAKKAVHQNLHKKPSTKRK